MNVTPQGSNELKWREFLVALLFITLAWASKEILGIDLLDVLGEPGGAIQIAFTAPQDAQDSELSSLPIRMDQRLIELIESARERAWVAAFDLESESIAEALLQAYRRGVDVRIVTDSDYLDERGASRLLAEGVAIVGDGREAFMHNKFVVLDEDILWTGSWNLTYNGTYRNDNNVVLVRSPALVENYSLEFDEMFTRHAFGPTSPPSVPYPDILLADAEARIETFFESEGNVRARLLKLIENSQASIRFMAFVFTDDALADALIAAHERGVVVQGVLEGRNLDIAGSDFDRLQGAGVTVLPDGNPYAMHHKVMIFDETIVVTGSYNFTRSAAESNDENALIIHSPYVADRYLDEFDRVWSLAQSGTGG